VGKATTAYNNRYAYKVVASPDRKRILMSACNVYRTKQTQIMRLMSLIGDMKLARDQHNLYSSVDWSTTWTSNMERAFVEADLNSKKGHLNVQTVVANRGSAHSSPLVQTGAAA